MVFLEKTLAMRLECAKITQLQRCSMAPSRAVSMALIARLWGKGVHASNKPDWGDRCYLPRYDAATVVCLAVRTSIHIDQANGAHLSPAAG